MPINKPCQKANRNKRIREISTIAFISIGTFLLAGYFDLYEAWQEWAKPNEDYQLDELVFAFLALSISLSYFSHRNYKRLQITLKKNMAISATLETINTEVVALLTQNRGLIKHITQVREAERNALATELHDIFGQHLAAIDVNITVACKYSQLDDKILNILNIIQTSTSYLIDVTRSQLQSIKPPNLESVGLSAGIESLVSQWLVSFSSYKVKLSIEVNDELVNYDVALTIYRCLQEALSNIVKHARAYNIDIELRTYSYDGINNEIILIIQDDGIGFTPNDDFSNGLGLIGMRERITALSGRLSINDAEHHGSLLKINIPL